MACQSQSRALPDRPVQCECGAFLQLSDNFCGSCGSLNKYHHHSAETGFCTKCGVKRLPVSNVYKLRREMEHV